jgi:hypothetical protein
MHGTMIRKRDGNHSPQKISSYRFQREMKKMNTQFLSSKRTKISDTKEPSNAHKNTLKEEILQVITENFMEKTLDREKQNVQDTLKKFQDNKNKEYEKTQKQINELIGALNEHQRETQNTINREINELKIKIENIKEEVTHDIEKLRKKNQTETQNTVEGHSSRLEQMEDGISELEDKTNIKDRTEEPPVKQLKMCERYIE